MKKMRYLFIFLAIFLVLTGCGLGNDKPVDKGEGTGSNTEVNKNDIVDKHGSIENLERLDTFIENVQNKIDDEVQLIRYTIEGDPIVYKLNFTEGKIEYTIDNSQDKYGSGEILSYDCKSVLKDETSTETKYKLEGCSNPEVEELLTISNP